MKKISTLVNFVHLSAMMVVVVLLLLVSMARESVAALFEKKKNTQHVKNKVPTTKHKSSGYMVHNKPKVHV